MTPRPDPSADADADDVVKYKYLHQCMTTHEMSTREEDYRDIDRTSDGVEVEGERARERGHDRTGTEYDHTDMEPGVKVDDSDDSVLVLEFLKRKRPLPSARRLDLMLSVLSSRLHLIVNSADVGKLCAMLRTGTRGIQ